MNISKEMWPDLHVEIICLSITATLSVHICVLIYHSLFQFGWNIDLIFNQHLTPVVENTKKVQLIVVTFLDFF